MPKALLAALLLLPALAAAETVTARDPQTGLTLGRAETHGGVTRFYNRSDRFLGEDRQHGNTVQHYTPGDRRVGPEYRIGPRP